MYARGCGQFNPPGMQQQISKACRTCFVGRFEPLCGAGIFQDAQGCPCHRPGAGGSVLHLNRIIPPRTSGGFRHLIRQTGRTDLLGLKSGRQTDDEQKSCDVAYWCWIEVVS